MISLLGQNWQQRFQAKVQITIECNQYSIFLPPVNEAEIIDIVNKAKNKTSTDCHDIDMALVNKLIDSNR